MYENIIWLVPILMFWPITIPVIIIGGIIGSVIDNKRANNFIPIMPEGHIKPN